MSDLAAKIAAHGSRITTTDHHIAVLDIERMKGSFSSEFWDLNDFKGRRIHPDDVTEWPRTICAAWKWYGNPKVHFASEWGVGGTEAMLKAIWDVYDKAEIVVGHNLAAFDSKKLKTAWRDAGMSAPSPWKTVDTLKVARAEFGDESRTLDAMCKRMGLVAKTDRYDVEVARAACAGGKKAQRQIRSYNEGDILATEALYDALRGWIPNHPHIGVLDESTMRCPRCASTDLRQTGTYLAAQIRYAQFQCGNCGGWLRSNRHSRAANIRAVRG